MPALSQTVEDFPCFTRSAETEIQGGGKKIVGSAQKILKNAILQHGSILLQNEHQKLSDYLSGNQGQLKAVRDELKDKTISLGELKKMI